MAKIFLSPLFLTLIALWTLQGWELSRKWNAGWSARMVGLCSLFVLSLLTAASMPIVADGLESSLSLDSFSERGAVFDAIVVLGGGYTREMTPGQDRLNGESVRRVTRGVEAFFDNKAKYLVVCGRSPE